MVKENSPSNQRMVLYLNIVDLSYNLKTENEWNLTTQLASYVNKYMLTHVSEKDIHEKILATNPIPYNVKGIQKLDEYIKEKLRLNQEKALKGTQEKVASILGPLTRFWSIMEAEREATSGHMEQLCLNKVFYL